MSSSFIFSHPAEQVEQLSKGISAAGHSKPPSTCVRWWDLLIMVLGQNPQLGVPFGSVPAATNASGNSKGVPLLLAPSNLGKKKTNSPCRRLLRLGGFSHLQPRWRLLQHPLEPHQVHRARNRRLCLVFTLYVYLHEGNSTKLSVQCLSLLFIALHEEHSTKLYVQCIFFLLFLLHEGNLTKLCVQRTFPLSFTPHRWNSTKLCVQ